MKKVFLFSLLATLAFSAEVTEQRSNYPAITRSHNLIVTIAQFLEPDGVRSFSQTSKAHQKAIIDHFFYTFSNSGWVVEGDLTTSYSIRLIGLPRIPRGSCLGVSLCILEQMVTERGNLFYIPTKQKVDRVKVGKMIPLLARYVNGSNEIMDYIVEGLHLGTHRFGQNHEEVRKLARLGWKKALACFSNRIRDWNNPDSFPIKNPVELRRLADLGEKKAQFYVASGLAEGFFGFKQDLQELRKLADLGWDWAQSFVAQGLAEGCFGFKQDPEELRELAVKWAEAQRFIARGLAKGECGFKQDLQELRRLADLGWNWAQSFVAEGLAEGEYGFDKNHEELRRLAVLHRDNNKNEYVVYYLKTLKPKQMLDFFLRESPEIGKLKAIVSGAPLAAVKSGASATAAASS